LIKKVVNFTKAGGEKYKQLALSSYYKKDTDTGW